ncbi:MAG TPA: transposase [Pseudonocardiaceae bacterium]|nr:transposase [Pseudonocardiaceae bacterium]
MPAVMEAPNATRPDTDVLEYCRSHLSSLARSDQRRWGEVYVRGLVSVPGRKSIRRIAEQVVGWRAEQCLQQFVNQSTWKWEPVRRSLAHEVTGLIRPKAWVALETAFPKNGTSSVGVAKQYAASAGRVLNCQLGLTVLLVGAEASCPVNWRLLLPQSWDDDHVRRIRTHLPQTQRHRPRWHYLVDAVDQMSIGWHLNAAPLLFDATHEPNLEPRLRSLEERGLRYLVRVSPNTPATRWAAYRHPGRVPTVGEIAALAGRPGAGQPLWQTCHDHTAAGTRIIATSQPRPEEVSWLPWRPASGPQQLFAEWPAGRSQPNALWLTNLSRTRLPELAELAALHNGAAASLRQMEETVGLQQFEGRSFPGWHHHVTLASMAYAYKLRQTMTEGAFALNR